VLTAILTVGCALALGACGSSSKKQLANSQTSAFIAFSKCMRAHGVTNFPDPSGAGGGLNLEGTGINPQSPSFRAAHAVCFKLLPGGGSAGQRPTAQDIKQATQTAQCMRKHGVTGFPDPTVSTDGLPDFNPARYGTVEDRDGVIIAIPKSINEQAPTFVAAAKICNFG
jgi:hypothetical protein